MYAALRFRAAASKSLFPESPTLPMPRITDENDLLGFPGYEEARHLTHLSILQASLDLLSAITHVL